MGEHTRASAASRARVARAFKASKSRPDRTRRAPTSRAAQAARSSAQSAKSLAWRWHAKAALAAKFAARAASAAVLARSPNPRAFVARSASSARTRVVRGIGRHAKASKSLTEERLRVGAGLLSVALEPRTGDAPRSADATVRVRGPGSNVQAPASLRPHGVGVGLLDRRRVGVGLRPLNRLRHRLGGRGGGRVGRGGGRVGRDGGRVGRHGRGEGVFVFPRNPALERRAPCPA